MKRSNPKEEVLDQSQVIQKEFQELKAYQAKGGLPPSTLALLDTLVQRHDLGPQDLGGLKLLLYRVHIAKVVNAVLPVYCHQKIDRDRVYLAALAQNLPAKKHQKFTGISVKFNHKGCKFTGIYFTSGSINCVGVKDISPQGIQAVLETLRYYAPKFMGQEVAEKCEYIKRIANRVLSTKIPKIIKLDQLHLMAQTPFWRECKYQTQIFPGLISIKQGLNAKLLFFRTGSLIATGITGSRVRNELALNLVEKLAYYIQLRREYLHHEV